MRYADPNVCPDCRTPLDGQPRCPNCALDLAVPAMARVWSGLVAVDNALVEARTQGSAATPRTAAPAPAPAPATPPQVNAGSVLLALGALFVLVAGAIFVAVAWSSLGIMGRSLVLLAFTTLMGALASVVTRRELRTSAEALWAVFLGLLTLDWFAAHAQGLADLDQLPWGVHAMLWSAVAVGASLGIVAHARRHVSVTLVVPSVVAGVATWAAGLGAASWYGEAGGYDDRLAWGGAAGLVAAALVTEALRRAGNQLGRQIGTAACLTFAAAATWLAAIDAVSHPSLADLTARAHGVPLLLAASGALTTAWFFGRLRPALTALAVAELAVLVAIPVEHGWPEHGAWLVGAVAVVASAAAAPGRDGWRVGLRWGSLVLAATVTLGTLPWVIPADGVIGETWVVAVVGLALTLTTLLAHRWQGGSVELGGLAGCAALVGLGTAVPLAATLELAIRPASLLVLIVGLAGVLGAGLVTRRPVRLGVEVGAALVSLLGIATALDSSLAWLALLSTVAGAVIALIGVVDERRPAFRWVGTGLLGLAWVLRLLASDVDVVEAYTAPFAAALLATGVYEMLRRPVLRSEVALSAGLTLALLPSLPLVLDDPTSLRAVLLGLVAAGCTAAGVTLRWRAPLVAGVATLAVIAVVELWPYAMAIERWTLMAAIGVALLGIGITWEQRVRNGRAVVRYVDAMR